MNSWGNKSSQAGELTFADDDGGTINSKSVSLPHKFMTLIFL